MGLRMTVSSKTTSASKKAGTGISRRELVVGALAASLARPALAQAGKPPTLRFVPQAGLTILDPTFSTTQITANHGFHVFDTLYGTDSHMQPRPQMAEGHTISDDQLTYTIKLREGLRFHDGEPVRAADCIASIKRWSFRDAMGRDLAAATEAHEIVDDRTFRIKLKRPFPLLLAALGKTFPYVPFIMPERLASLDTGKPITEMVGSGPYRFVANEFVVGSRAVYQKFDGYTPRAETAEFTAGGKIAHFERIEWTAMPDASTAAAALQAGEIDWWEQANADLLPVLRRNKNIEVARIDTLGVMPTMRFNSLQKPFNNPAIRKAILSAVDQTPYLDAVTANDPTSYQTCHSFFPCGSTYGEVPRVDPMANPSIQRAAKALQDAGYNGEKIVLLNPADFPTIAPLGHVTEDLLRKLDMNVELVETDWGSLVSRVQNREPVEKGGWSLYHTWWGVGTISYPSTNTLIRGSGTRGWTGWYESAEMEALNTAWLTATDTVEQKRLAMQMQELAFQDAPSVPLGQFFLNSAYRRSITGVLPGRIVPWNVRPA